MKRKKYKSFVCILTLIVFSTSFCPVALAEPVASPSQKAVTEPGPADTYIDVLFYRPVGLVLIPVGAVLFVASLPFSITGGNVPSAFNNLVTAPAQYTFCRPLGDI